MDKKTAGLISPYLNTNIYTQQSGDTDLLEQPKDVIWGDVEDIHTTQSRSGGGRRLFLL